MFISKSILWRKRLFPRPCRLLYHTYFKNDVTDPTLTKQVVGALRSCSAILVSFAWGAIGPAEVAAPLGNVTATVVAVFLLVLGRRDTKWIKMAWKCKLKHSLRAHIKRVSTNEGKAAKVRGSPFGFHAISDIFRCL